MFCIHFNHAVVHNELPNMNSIFVEFDKCDNLKHKKKNLNNAVIFSENNHITKKLD